MKSPNSPELAHRFPGDFFRGKWISPKISPAPLRRKEAGDFAAASSPYLSWPRLERSFGRLPGRVPHRPFGRAPGPIDHQICSISFEVHS
jgi:hypothetical protein